MQIPVRPRPLWWGRGGRLHAEHLHRWPPRLCQPDSPAARLKVLLQVNIRMVSPFFFLCHRFLCFVWFFCLFQWCQKEAEVGIMLSRLGGSANHDSLHHTQRTARPHGIWRWATSWLTKSHSDESDLCAVEGGTPQLLSGTAITAFQSLSQPPMEQATSLYSKPASKRLNVPLHKKSSPVLYQVQWSFPNLRMNQTHFSGSRYDVHMGQSQAVTIKNKKSAPWF